MNTTTLGKYQVPVLIPVTTATIAIPSCHDHRGMNLHGSLEAFEHYVSSTYHVLSLLSEKDKSTCESDEDGWRIQTSNSAAIKYAEKHYLLDEVSTAFDLFMNHLWDTNQIDDGISADDACEYFLSVDPFRITKVSDGDIYVRFAEA